MESSRRAVEAYWRTRLIDQVTVDDDKVAPVYLLDEISDTIRSSPSETVRDLVEYTLKRLRHKSPRVKQKALRMIKYVVAKSGPEFRRQIQRQSTAIRQLFDYKGQTDSLRGDALNKAVRETAHEAIAAVFATDEKISQMEDVNKRIMGFGNTNFDMPPQGKKSLINDVVNEVVEFGSSSIRQSLNKISGYTSSGNGGIRTNDSGSYRGPSLRKSLTSERETFDRYEREEPGDVRFVSEASSGRTKPSTYDSRFSQQEVSNGKGGAENGRGTSREEMLLDNITAPGGMRLQPTRENLQMFLTSALKLDPKNLGNALESKIRSHAWQVRLKALCVLEAILHQEDTDFYGIVVDMFEKEAGAIYECLQCPQTSVREKAKKVLDCLKISSKDSCGEEAEGLTDLDGPPPSVVHDMPDLIDTSEPDLLGDANSFPEMSVSTLGGDVSSSSNSAITGGALSGDGLLSGAAGTASGTDSDDLFAGVSVHMSDSAAGELTGDLFSGLFIDDNNKPSGDGEVDLLLNNQGTAISHSTPSGSLVDLMGNISLSNSGDSVSLSGLGENGALSTQVPHHGNASPPQMPGNLSIPQLMYMNPSLMLPTTGMVGGFQAPIMIPQNFGAGALGNAFLQQQLLSGMTGLQRFRMGTNLTNGGNLQTNTGSGRVLSASFADGFDFSGDAASRYTAADFTKKEDTKAFDFISDHVCAARGVKKIP